MQIYTPLLLSIFIITINFGLAYRIGNKVKEKLTKFKLSLIQISLYILTYYILTQAYVEGYEVLSSPAYVIIPLAIIVLLDRAISNNWFLSK